MAAPAHAQVRARARPPGFPAPLIAGNLGPLCFNCRDHVCYRNWNASS